MLADVPVQLGHEGLAEAHDLGVRPAVRVEVAAALAAADAQAGQGVLEDLLEAQELHHADVHRRVEAQAALVRAERTVELDAVAAVDVDAAPAVLPRDAEEDLPLGFREPLHQGHGRVGVLGPGGEDGGQGLEDLPYRLVELGLRGVAALDLGPQVFQPVLRVLHVCPSRECAVRRRRQVHGARSESRSGEAFRSPDGGHPRESPATRGHTAPTIGSLDDSMTRA